MKKWFIVMYLLWLMPFAGNAFSFTVAATNESCSGNGALTFSATNTDPNGTIVYEVYKLPNLSVPLATVTGNNLGGLSAGTYKIIAKETVNGVTTSQELQTTINNTIQPLVIDVDSINQACSANSNIVVNTVSGTPVNYEIFSGPVTFPLQTSNTFDNLPVGVYRIRVFDACGTGVVSTFTVTLNVTGLNIAQPTFTNTTPPSCNFTVVEHTITPANGTVIGYPLQIEFVVHPPGGTPDQTFNSVLNNGNLSSEQISETIPAFPNQNYDYDVNILDACGSTFTQNFLVTNNINLLPTIYDLDCNTYYFELKATNFTPPYNLNFSAFPAGFDPTTFTANYPGPYNTDIVQFGDVNLHTPVGNYEVTITDACGRSKLLSFNIINLPSVPTATAINNGCSTNSGNIYMNIVGYRIVVAKVMSAPPTYPFITPHDVSQNVDPTTGILTLSTIPVGDYSIEVTNNCGDTMAAFQITVPIYTNQGMSSEKRPGCALGRESIKIWSNNIGLTSLKINAGPVAFGQTFPFDISSYIAPDGVAYLNDLPPGNYTFEGVDQCNFTNQITVNIVGYTVTNNVFSLQENCGSFDIPFDFTSNATAGETYWLQKEIAPNQWGHPDTLQPYTEGTIPDANNSFQITNHATNYNLSFNGVFRIVRSFFSFNNGMDIRNNNISPDKNCLEILSPTLSFNQVLQITDAYRMPCSSNGNLDVIIEANGKNPIHYTIVEKDGQPFFVDNLNSNIFYNLAPGLYTFLVEDPCGSRQPQIFDVSSLLSLVQIGNPTNMLQCYSVITGNETFDLTQQTSIIMNNQSASDYTLSFHPSLADAQNNTNRINNLTTYNPSTNPATIYARMIYNAVPNCYETVSFDLIAGQTPTIGLNNLYQSCFSNPVSLDASGGNLSSTTYNWSDGTTQPTITVTQSGITNLTITATNDYGNGQICSNTKDIEVRISETPVIDHLETSDWTQNENSISVYTQNSGQFEYSIDGTNYQDSSVFTGLEPGVYTVYVRDKLGCGIDTESIWLLYYPNFFTPNDDGYNDTWFIENGALEPNMTVYIFDRYGKLITGLDKTHPKWDGQYNGNQAVSTDYWFVVNRQDGRVHNGHFALKR
ncbi:MAG: T9SS type B sorting domain-containing protein [Flavobacteriaceae bacterium]